MSDDALAAGRVDAGRAEAAGDDRAHVRVVEARADDHLADHVEQLVARERQLEPDRAARSARAGRGGRAAGRASPRTGASPRRCRRRRAGRDPRSRRAPRAVDVLAVDVDGEARRDRTLIAAHSTGRLDRVVGAVALPALVRDARRRRGRARSRGRARRPAGSGRPSSAGGGPEREPLGEQLVHDLVAERQVRDRRGDLRVRVEADLALHERVPVDAQAVRVAHERLLAEAVGARRRRGCPARSRRPPPSRARARSWLVVNTAWSAAIFDVDRAAHVREPVDVLRRRRLLDPVEVVLLEPPDAVDRGRAVPRLVRVDPQQRLGPDRLAHGRDAGVVALARRGRP